jgi:hypothetical protein
VTDIAVIRPRSDPIETTLSRWADLLLPTVGLPGVAVIYDLAGSAATPAATKAACGAVDVTLFFCHGTEKTLGIPTLLDTTSVAAAAGRVIIAIACLSSDTLGPSAVAGSGVSNYLGCSEPLFVYNLRPALIGAQIAQRIGDYLTGATSLRQARDDLETDLRAIEALYHTGVRATHPDAMLIWMGTRMNWRGLALD